VARLSRSMSAFRNSSRSKILRERDMISATSRMASFLVRALRSRWIRSSLRRSASFTPFLRFVPHYGTNAKMYGRPPEVSTGLDGLDPSAGPRRSCTPHGRRDAAEERPHPGLPRARSELAHLPAETGNPPPHARCAARSAAAPFVGRGLRGGHP